MHQNATWWSVETPHIGAPEASTHSVDSFRVLVEEFFLRTERLVRRARAREAEDIKRGCVQCGYG